MIYKYIVRLLRNMINANAHNNNMQNFVIKKKRKTVRIIWERRGHFDGSDGRNVVVQRGRISAYKSLSGTMLV